MSTKSIDYRSLYNTYLRAFIDGLNGARLSVSEVQSEAYLWAVAAGLSLGIQRRTFIQESDSAACYDFYDFKTGLDTALTALKDD